ncbi:MAG: phosphoribosyltransferase family protein [Sphingobacteriaceae bacterium]|jgi:pyrimidine operon attenuation protein/uracil phosphoribosyltransferase
MAAKKSIQILDQAQIKQKIDRIAYQILEDCFDEKEIIIAGIASRGYVFAQKLEKVLCKISKINCTLVEITLDKDSNNLVASTNIPVSQCKNKTIILVDDVLNSGRTLLYGLSVFLNIPTKKIRTAVLVDRSHKLFPISTDYAGYTISTVSQEHISVVFDKNKDAVYLS